MTTEPALPFSPTASPVGEQSTVTTNAVLSPEPVVAPRPEMVSEVVKVGSNYIARTVATEHPRDHRVDDASTDLLTSFLVTIGVVFGVGLLGLRRLLR